MKKSLEKSQKKKKARLNNLLYITCVILFVSSVLVPLLWSRNYATPTIRLAPGKWITTQYLLTLSSKMVLMVFMSADHSWHATFKYLQLVEYFASSTVSDFVCLIGKWTHNTYIWFCLLNRQMSSQNQSNTHSFLTHTQPGLKMHGTHGHRWPMWPKPQS